MNTKRKDMVGRRLLLLMGIFLVACVLFGTMGLQADTAEYQELEITKGHYINDMEVMTLDCRIYELEETDANWYDDEYNVVFEIGQPVDIILLEDQVVALYYR